MKPIKKDDNKLPMHLLPVDPMLDVVRVLQFGAQKYTDHNWRGGFKWSRVMNAVERHIAAWKKGETHDDESGLNHLAHAACNLFFLLEYSRTSQHLDDRYTRGAAHSAGDTRIYEFRDQDAHDTIEGPCQCGAWHVDGK